MTAFDRPQADLKVLGDGHVVRVGDVEIDRGVPVEVRPTTDLPQAGHPRLDRQSPAAVLVVLLDFLRERRAWADERHLTAHHVEQLGQLVQRGLAQDATDAG